MKILAIDPGLTGALAVHDAALGTFAVFDIPTHALKRGKSVKTTLDAYELARLVDAHGPIDRAVIEAVGATPQMGVTSAFSFGQVFGTIIGVVAASFIPVEFVSPVKWKRELAVPADKDGARARASALLPFMCGHWTRAKDHGRAEACLIALWAAKIGGGP